MSAVLASVPTTDSVVGTPVVLYDRISRDRNATKLANVRQDKRNEAYVHAAGLGTIVARFSDNDRTAYGGNDGPDFRAMCELIESGELAGGVLVAWHLDRITRDTAQYAWLRKFLKFNGVRLVTVTAGHLDPTSAAGVLMAEQQVSMAQYESAHRSERLVEKHAELAEAGKYHGGKRRYGYNANMTAVDEAEAEVIREIARRILNEETLHAIARDLNERGVKTAAGKVWRGPNLAKFITGEHLAGIRVHNGAKHPAAWPAILDEDTHRQLGLVLNDPTRGHGKATTRRWALAGLALCGVCEAPVVSARNNSGTASYVCSTRRHVHRPIGKVHEVVFTAVAWRLAAVDASGVLVAPTDNDEASRAKERARLDAKLDEVADMLANDELTREQAARATAKHRAALAKLDAAEVTDTRPARTLAGLTGHTPTEARRLLDGLPLDRQRAVVDTLATVYVDPAPGRGGSGGATFDPTTVRVVWKRE